MEHMNDWQRRRGVGMFTIVHKLVDKGNLLQHQTVRQHREHRYAASVNTASTSLRELGFGAVEIFVQ